MSAPLPQAGWYPDPVVPGAQRYWDGTTWTQHVAPPPPTMPPGWYLAPQPQWKGARFGLPAAGPGALATPARRLGARCLDALLLLPIFIALCVIAVSLAIPRVGPIFPKVTTGNPTPTPGFLWIYWLIIGCFVATGAVMVVYETIATAKWGRTLGKKWVRIRPLQADGTALGWGRALGRVVFVWLATFLSWIGLLDSLWCLWDGDHQCLHDKIVHTVVVNDPVSPRPQGTDLRAQPNALS